jgi:hypothetical protein
MRSSQLQYWRLTLRECINREPIFDFSDSHTVMFSRLKHQNSSRAIGCPVVLVWCSTSSALLALTLCEFNFSVKCQSGGRCTVGQSVETASGVGDAMVERLGIDAMKQEVELEL